MPSTPKHQQIKENTINDTHLDIMMNTSSNTNNNSTRAYWEGPPAHFMLPTHAIHCRSSRSVERCPRACKGKPSVNQRVNTLFFSFNVVCLWENSFCCFFLSFYCFNFGSLLKECIKQNPLHVHTHTRNVSLALFYAILNILVVNNNLNKR